MRKFINKNITKIAFGIGSNLGNRERNINSAIDKLQKNLSLLDLKISNFYENKAMLPDSADQSWNKDFLNIALIGNFDRNQFSPIEILKIIKIIEKEIGRTDSPRWSPRIIDIDILAILDEPEINYNNLKIPHDGLFKRDFFYKTFGEIDLKWLELLKNNNC
jgi:2-amino-4-hydroxy-6-hydroxymethyldihydropteridine diphosphokinase